MEAGNTDVELQRVRIWDLPVRLFHWCLVALILFSWWSGKEGGNYMLYHMWSGYTVLTLVVFRLIWGFCGSASARFAGFLRGPGAVIAYVRSLPQRRGHTHAGHNPLGGWSVVLLLACLLLQASTGLFANDDIATEGPLSGWVSKATSDFLTTIHFYNFYVLLALAAVHLCAVLFYLFYKAENLIGPMFSGYKMRPADEAAQPGRFASNWLAGVLLALVAGGVYLLVK
jgi:cytochrome b